MKNKRLTYILVPAVVLVWILIILKVLNYKGNDEPATVQTQQTSVQKYEGTENYYELLLNYEDPFQINIQSTNNIEEENKQKKFKTDKTVKRPQVKYSGMVINQETSRVQINISINGKYFLMSYGETIDELTLNHIYPDSIKLSFHHESYYVKKPK